MRSSILANYRHIVFNGILLGINLGNEVILLGKVGARSCVEGSKEVGVEGVVEEIIKGWVGHYILLGLSVSTEQLRIELATVLLRQPSKTIGSKVNIGKVGECLLRVIRGQLLLADGAESVDRLEAHRRLRKGFRRSATGRAGPNVGVGRGRR